MTAAPLQRPMPAALADATCAAFDLPADGRAVALRAGCVGRLRVRSGSVWLTRAGDPDDHFLGRGAQWAVRPGDTVWLSGDLPQSAARIAWEPAVACRPRRASMLDAAWCWATRWRLGAG